MGFNGRKSRRKRNSSRIAKGGDKQAILSGSSQWEKGTIVMRSEGSRSRSPGCHMTCSKFLKHHSRC